jgi:hypothetical protein
LRKKSIALLLGALQGPFSHRCRWRPARSLILTITMCVPRLPIDPRARRNRSTDAFAPETKGQAATESTCNSLSSDLRFCVCVCVCVCPLHARGLSRFSRKSRRNVCVTCLLPPTKRMCVEISVDRLIKEPYNRVLLIDTERHVIHLRDPLWSPLLFMGRHELHNGLSSGHR